MQPEMDAAAITVLLKELQERGSADTADHLIPIVFRELRNLAELYIRREGPSHTLQPTALVHEAYLRLVGDQARDWQNRAQFIGVAASIMRRLLIDHARKKRAEKRQLRLWSAASSTGQEAYSLAMLIAEDFPLLAGWDVKIFGTDISRQVIDYARRGRYRRLEVNRGLPARMLLKYMERDGEEWEVCARIRSMCEFEYANLCSPLPKLPLFDLVMLRNVLLYFPQRDRRRLFREVHRQMEPDGCLVLGNAEQAEDSTKLFEVEFASNSYFYRPISSGL